MLFDSRTFAGMHVGTSYHLDTTHCSTEAKVGSPARWTDIQAVSPHLLSDPLLSNTEQLGDCV